jgi:hypothetical protein
MTIPNDGAPSTAVVRRLAARPSTRAIGPGRHWIFSIEFAYAIEERYRSGASS